MSSTPTPNIRSLLRAELSTRRIHHPHASYTNKSNLLSCTVCHLVIKSDSLWAGHLRSVNHRRNVQKSQERDGGLAANGGESKKRKAGDTENDSRDGEGELAATSGGRKRKADEDDGHADGMDRESRKKTKSQLGQPLPSGPMSGFVPASTGNVETAPASESLATADAQSSIDLHSAQIDIPSPHSPSTADISHLPASTASPQVQPTINESEWAAFEADIAPLAHSPALKSNLTRTNSTHHAAAIISAAPMSASELSAQKAAAEEAERKKSSRISREEEAEAEREDEGRRLEAEFEVQEEMEGRARRLRERLGLLRRGTGTQLAGENGDGQAKGTGEETVHEKVGHVESREGRSGGGGGGGGGGEGSSEDEAEDHDFDEFDELGLR